MDSRRYSLMSSTENGILSVCLTGREKGLNSHSGIAIVKQRRETSLLWDQPDRADGIRGVVARGLSIPWMYCGVCGEVAKRGKG